MAMLECPWCFARIEDEGGAGTFNCPACRQIVQVHEEIQRKRSLVKAWGIGPSGEPGSGGPGRER